MLSNPIASSPERALSDAGSSNTDTSSSSGKGTWTKEEHERFLKATELYPQGPWKKIAEMVRTRTIRQTQTHAQKYREKLARHHRGLRTRSFGQNQNATSNNQMPPVSSTNGGSGVMRSHLPPPGRSSLPPPPSHGLLGGHHHSHHQPHHLSHHHSQPPLSSRPLSHHLPPHHHHHHSMLWTPPHLPQLHESGPSHGSSSHGSHSYGLPPPPSSSSAASTTNANGEPTQNFSQSMQYLMDFYEPAVPAHHFPVDHNNHTSYTVYNEPVDVFRRHKYHDEQ
ncbi:Aste57867_18427 [Aphanomyces stellatus]|uniref:Aste57867_18427 protein n=1 Tax=Aphanomyces stellatus TaxID=120398 RepID=A0A485LA21_9STRA|nr:hypothetical protein As57867_018365 [Aphanomyces stellatus]VFT95163.1 Aste57867_18427 [Aphanomyces stellatus]